MPLSDPSYLHLAVPLLHIIMKSSILNLYIDLRLDIRYAFFRAHLYVVVPAG